MVLLDPYAAGAPGAAGRVSAARVLTTAFVFIPFLAVLACSPPGEPVEVESTASRQQIIARFTNDIWPAVEGYRLYAQGSPESKRFWSVVEPGEASTVHAAGIDLGVVMGADNVPITFRVGPLRLAHTTVTSIDATDATVVACYTYTSVPHNHPADPGAAAASEATFALHKTDDWYLHSITDDHVVPGCGAVNG